MAQMFDGGKCGDFGQSLVIHQILPSKLMMCTIKKANKQEFAKVFLSQTFTLSSIQH